MEDDEAAGHLGRGWHAERAEGAPSNNNNNNNVRATWKIISNVSVRISRVWS